MKNTLFKKLTNSVVTLVVLCVCLCITSLALAIEAARVDGHFFQTGDISINLNDNKPLIKEYEFLFEPGTTVEKDFFIENKSTWSVYYKLYFTNVQGDLADILDVTIQKGDQVLYQGKASDLTKEKANAADSALRVGEKQVLTIRFHYPENEENEGQSSWLTFDLAADAVQTKNNSNKEFV